MLYRMRQTDGQHYGSGKWIAPDGKTEMLASADITMTPLAFTEIEGRKIPTAWRIAIPRMALSIECTPLNARSWMGTELSLLGRPDQLCRQPYRGGLSGNDGLLSASTKQGEFQRCITSPRSSPAGGPGLLLLLHPGVAGARQIRRQGAGHFGQSGFRARVSRADEHAGMAADLPAVAVAVCDLYRRRHRRRDRAGLGDRPHPLRVRLCQGGQDAARALRSRRWRRSRCGWARSARSCGGWCRRERTRRHVVPANARDPYARAERSDVLTIHRRTSASGWARFALRHRDDSLTSPAGSRNPSPPGTPCRRGPRRAACSNPTASSIPTAS